MKAMSKFEAEYEKYRLLLEEENSRGIFRIDGPGAAAEAELSANSINRHLSEDSGEDESAGWRKMVDQIDPAYQNLAMNDLRRELGRKLYLIVREKNSGKWCLPSALVVSEKRALSSVHIKRYSFTIRIIFLDRFLTPP